MEESEENVNALKGAKEIPALWKPFLLWTILRLAAQKGKRPSLVKKAQQTKPQLSIPP